MQCLQRFQAMQRILVCAQDPVLAKKVRFLMERDECKVEILSVPRDLDKRLQEDHPSLIVLSREIEGEDSVDWVAQLGTDDIDRPPTLILGGHSRTTADFIHLVPDPVDTQAIYREANRLLQNSQARSLTSGNDGETVPDTSDPLTNGASELNDNPDSQLEDNLEDALEYEEASSSSPENSMLSHSVPSPIQPTAVPADDQPHQNLTPEAFARTLHRLWFERENGAVVVSRNDERTTIYLEEGKPIAVTFSHRGDALGSALVERGRITQAQYADTAIRSIESGTTLAEAVINLGLLTEDDLGKELGTSAKEALVSIFSAESGSFWVESDLLFDSADRPYRLEVPHIIAQGFRTFANEDMIESILGEDLTGYFRLRRPRDELQRDYPLSKGDIQFLSFESRAYNVEDAADGGTLSLEDARRLMAILTVCSEVEPFSPGPKEFEARIREERETRKKLESKVPLRRSTTISEPTPDTPTSSPSYEQTSPEEAMSAEALDTQTQQPTEDTPKPESPDVDAEVPSFPAFQSSSNPEPIPTTPSVLGQVSDGASGAVVSSATPTPTSPRPTTPSPTPVHDPDIPPMPLPSDGEGSVPHPIKYAKSLPRAVDGALLDTPERAVSREHFQNGVNLLGKGNFSSAEDHFRDAVALCSEEHVYLIGLARAIYYNPAYRADGKVPVLRNIVERASQLAPDDKRVSTLETWVSHAETNYI